MENKNFGYIPDIITPDNYVLGASPLPQEILRFDGQWVALLPDFEPQSRRFETANCTAYGTLNCLELLFLKVFGASKNFSDRALGIMAGTRPPGNSPHTVIQAARHGGLIKEESLPFTDAIQTVEEYYSPDPLTKPLADEGLDFLKNYSIGHEWVFSSETGNEIERMKQALRFSPLGASVHAWKQRNGLYYKDPIDDDNHWVCVVGYKENEYWIIFDSYRTGPDHEFIKRLEWSFNFGQVKRYHLQKNLTPQEKTNFLIAIYQSIVKLLQDLILYRQQENALIPPIQPLPDAPQAPSVITEAVPNAPFIVETPVKETMKEMVKRICREQKLTQVLSERLYKVVECESNFLPTAIHHNRSKKTGKILSTDYGICQFNDFYWIGKDKLFPSSEYVLQNPEACIREMCKLWKQGKMNLWVCYQRLYG